MTRKQKPLDDKQLKELAKLQQRIFVLTDLCMWEANKKSGAYHPHAIQVVDLETGQVRFIKSGSKIRFYDGDITETSQQDDYNNLTKK